MHIFLEYSDYLRSLLSSANFADAPVHSSLSRSETADNESVVFLSSLHTVTSLSMSSAESNTVLRNCYTSTKKISVLEVLVAASE